MNFDIYFPLFENILHGNLNPQLSANDDGYHYTARLEEMIIVTVKDTGIYGLNFQQPFNLKTRYYHRKILADTLLYIADMQEVLQEETDNRIRSFMRNQLLDKHLTTCLMRLGEKIQKEALYIELLNDSTNQVSNNQLSNIFVFQFLKVCIAKAFLEIQNMLTDVVIVKQSEAMLYSSLVCEKFPVKQFLKRRKPPGMKHEAAPNSTITKKTHYTTKEALAVLGYSESTLLRQKKDHNFPVAVKQGNKDMYLKSEIDAWSIARL